MTGKKTAVFGIYKTAAQAEVTVDQLLAGIGALTIPGVGPFIAAGPIMGALAGLGVGGAEGISSTGESSAGYATTARTSRP